VTVAGDVLSFVGGVVVGALAGLLLRHRRRLSIRIDVDETHGPVTPPE
jgi:hypothetical protein